MSSTIHPFTPSKKVQRPKRRAPSKLMALFADLFGLRRKRGLAVVPYRKRSRHFSDSKFF